MLLSTSNKVRARARVRNFTGSEVKSVFLRPRSRLGAAKSISCRRTVFVASKNKSRSETDNTTITMTAPAAKVLIKSVFFDMDDTLVLTSDCDELAFVQVSQLAKKRVSGVNTEELIAGFKAGMKEKPWDKEYKIHVDEWRAGLWNESLSKQNLSNMEVARELQTEYRTVRLSHFKFLQGAEDMVKRLQAKGVRVVIITNGHHEVQRQKIVACEAEKLFGKNIIVGGEEVLKGEEEKPHPSIFAKACSLANCEAKEAIHVGDSLKTDIQGGINAHVAATVWINAPKKERPTGSPTPNFTVERVTELEKILEENFTISSSA